MLPKKGMTLATMKLAARTTRVTAKCVARPASVAAPGPWAVFGLTVSCAMLRGREGRKGRASAPPECPPHCEARRSRGTHSRSGWPTRANATRMWTQSNKATTMRSGPGGTEKITNGARPRPAK